MKYIATVLIVVLTATPVLAATPTHMLEQQIAERQGKFGAYYMRCGTPEERAVVAGDLSKWRDEVMLGYNGSVQDRSDMVTAFEKGAKAVVVQASCADWVKKAAAEWNAIVQLSEYGRIQSAGNMM